MTYYLIVECFGIFDREALCEQEFLLEMQSEFRHIRQDTSRYIYFSGKQQLRTIWEKSVRKSDQSCSTHYGTRVQI